MIVMTTMVNRSVVEHLLSQSNIQFDDLTDNGVWGWQVRFTLPIHPPVNAKLLIESVHRSIVAEAGSGVAVGWLGQRKKQHVVTFFFKEPPL